MSNYQLAHQKPPFRIRFWVFCRGVHQVFWVIGAFIGIPAVMIPVLGWIPQVRAAIGYCITWGLLISFIVYLVRSLIWGVPS